MPVSIFFSLREIRRRPRSFIALAGMSAAILTALIMMLLYLNANWRNDVVPKRPSNYHFQVLGLSNLEKRQLAAEPWVLATYEDIKYNKDGELLWDHFNVRAIWSENLTALNRAYEIFDRFGLWSRDEYSRKFNSFYDENLQLLKKEYSTISPNYVTPYGTTIAQEATKSAKYRLITSNLVKNVSYCRAVINSYIIRPEFFALMSMFSLFLCGATMIMTSERYRRRMAEFGSLRSLGIKRRQLYYICCIDNLLANLAAIPTGILASQLIVKLYSLVFADILADDSVFLKLETDLPIAAILIISVMMTLVSLGGCILVCYTYRGRSVMELLKKEGSVRVSYVAKTSPRFEIANSFRIYPKLEQKRTRFGFFLATAVIVIMMPLPLSYLVMSVATLFSPDLSAAARAEGMYYAFQAAVMFLTSTAVIYISSRSRTELRHGELGILRSLGMTKRMIRHTAYPSAVTQIFITTLPAVALFMRLSDTTSRTSSANRNYGYTLGGLLSGVLTESLGVILLIAPPILIGTAASLLRFMRRSIIESIRENE